MSYCSNVRITINAQDFEDLKKGLAQLDQETAYNKDIILNKAIITPVGYGCLLLKWDFEKWDEATNEAVEYIINFLHSCKNSYHYIRVREGVGDKEDKYEGFYISSEDEFIAESFLEIARKSL